MREPPFDTRRQRHAPNCSHGLYRCIFHSVDDDAEAAKVVYKGCLRLGLGYRVSSRTRNFHCSKPRKKGPPAKAKRPQERREGGKEGKK